MRVKMLAGNWKMHKSNPELVGFFDRFVEAVGLDKDEELTERVDVVFAVPYTLLQRSVELGAPQGIRIAAQNIHWAEQGAFTGEVSIPMIKDIGVVSTLIGHSERRLYFGETDETVAKKVQAAIAGNVTPIVCVGESLREREAQLTETVVTEQVTAFLSAIEETRDLIIAYEPVWAIGTGKSATTEQAQEVHALIRSILTEHFGRGVGEATRILYGGSANPANIDDLLQQPDIDGALVGGASLKPDDFAQMVLAGLKYTTR